MSRIPHAARLLRRPACIGMLVLVALASACSSADREGEPVVLDGLFDEWSTAATILDDPADAPDAGVDILSVHGLDEGPWLYLALDVGNEVTLQSMPGTLHLVFDTDGSRSTGSTEFGMNGVDLIVDLSAPAPSGPGERGVGFALRAVDDSGHEHDIERYALGLMAAPTWSAPRFELRIARGGGPGLAPFGSRYRLKAVYEKGGRTLEDTAIGSYVFTSRATPLPPPSVHAAPSKPDGATRVAQWNMASQWFDEHTEDFAALLGAVAPDVILLDELPSDIDDAKLTAFFAMEPLRRLGSWTFVLGATGGVQRAAVAARDLELRPARWLASVPYPDRVLSQIDELAAEASDDFSRRSLEAEPGRGVSAAGAWVPVGDVPTLFVVGDLQSAGWAGSVQDRLRALQASVIRDHVAQELAESAAPVVIGGDFNIVGSRTPLFFLTRGLDADGSDLLIVDAMRLGERTLATWRNPRDRFTPGRLDFVLVSESVLSVAASFVLAPEDLDDAALEQLGLARGSLFGTLSDHAVSVVDLVPAARP